MTLKTGHRAHLPVSRYSPKQLLRREWLRLAVATATYYTGLAFLWNALSSRPRARILMYHSIADDPSDLHSVLPEAFEQHMQFLASKRAVVPLDQLVAGLRAEGRLPHNAVAITFDDGWDNTYTTAYPILRRYNLPATVFIIPDRVDLEPDRPRSDGRRHMTWDQIRELYHNGISIGAHTLSHRSLTTLALDEVRHELVESKVRLEQQLGQPVRFFAYPFGALRDINRDIVQLVAESGYAAAVTSLSGTNGRHTNPYALRRTEIEVVDGDGNPMADEEYVLYLPNGTVRTGTLDGSGCLREDNVPPGFCSIRFPDLPGFGDVG